MLYDEMAQRVFFDRGFVAALDQSGGSTPGALELYGVTKNQYRGADEMMALIHEMRARIIKSPDFDGKRILGAILFEATMDASIDGVPTSRYLWEKRSIVPFLKVDAGLEAEADGVRMMKPIPTLDDMLRRAQSNKVFGTKMRSIISAASPLGIAAIVAQQFTVSAKILDNGLVPIIEPEVTIGIADKAAAEALLRDELIANLDRLPGGQRVILKLTLPEKDDFYSLLTTHANVGRVVALSGGYTRDEACDKLSRNARVVASFSRALIAGLKRDMSDDVFDRELSNNIKKIYGASV